MMACFTSYSLSGPCLCAANLDYVQNRTCSWNRPVSAQQSTAYTPSVLHGSSRNFPYGGQEVGFFLENDYEEASLNMETLV